MTTSTDRRISDSGQEFDVLLDRLFGKKWWIVSSILVSSALFGVYAFLAQPIYEASAILVSSSDESASGLNGSLDQIGGLAALAGISVGSSGAEVQKSLAVLKSRQFTEAFIRDHNLLPKLFPSKWDEHRGGWRVGVSKQPSLYTGYRYFDREIRTVVYDKRTGLVTLEIDWPDSQEAATLANELIESVNEEMRSRAIRDANAAMAYLEKEYGATSTVVTREAIGRLIEVQVKRRMMANVTQEFAFRVIDKALPADVRYPIRPKKAFLVVAGAIAGCVVGVIVALLLSRKARHVLGAAAPG